MDKSEKMLHIKAGLKLSLNEKTLEDIENMLINGNEVTQSQTREKTNPVNYQQETNVTA